MIQLTQEEYDELRFKAHAWDVHVHNRLAEGFVRAKFIIECISGEAHLRIHDAHYVTPFGKFQISQNPNGYATYGLRQGDNITIDTEAKLSIN